MTRNNICTGLQFTNIWIYKKLGITAGASVPHIFILVDLKDLFHTCYFMNY